MHYILKSTNRIILIFTAAAALYLPVLCSAETPDSSRNIIKKYIIEYNLRTLDQSRDKDSYRGEQGILRLRPDMAESLKMKVKADSAYKESKRLFKGAEDALRSAKRLMAGTGGRYSSDELSEQIVEKVLLYRSKKDLAEKSLAEHLSRIDTNEDERFNEEICHVVMDRLLEECFGKNKNRLRDSLAQFYNRCQGIATRDFPLCVQNVRFVNHVFNGFIKEASPEEQGLFDLDREPSSSQPDSWKNNIEEKVKGFVPIIETAVINSTDKSCRVDPFLFISLMKRESAFNPSAVSGVGAAGLTQIMPLTGKDLGLENIFMPPYFDEAGQLLKKERDLKREARASLMKIFEKSDQEYAKEAVKLMQESITLANRRKNLFDRYKKELLKNCDDDRLKPAKAIESGLEYFAELLKRQNGDISLALASYNAGPHRVREYEGIPPFNETVGFRNMVLKFYRNYLERSSKEKN